jgi:hypothetical protein
MRQFTHGEISRTTNVLKALLPPGVSCSTTSINTGWQLSISVCGDTCKVYNVHPGSLSDKLLLDIAAEWSADGTYLPRAAPGSAASHARDVIEITSTQQLTTWTRQAQHGARAIYHRGQLAQFRHDTQREIVRLQAREDQGKLRSADRVHLQNLQDSLELIEAVGVLHQARKIELVQVRLPDGSGGATYYAVKK